MREPQKTGTVEINGRKYPIFSDGTIGTMVRINDEAQPYLAYLARTLPGEFYRALRHVGWWLRKEIQDAIYHGGPRSRRWPALSDIQELRVLDDLKGRPRPPRTHPFGNLVRAIAYKHEPEKQRVRVGWLSRAAAIRGAELQEGFKDVLTPKVRSFFWAAGLPLSKDKTFLRTPARPLFGPIFFEKQKESRERIEKKFLSFLKKS